MKGYSMVRRTMCGVLWLSLFLGSCATYRPVPAPSSSLQRGREQARECMSALDVRAVSEPTDFMAAYLTTYGLTFESIPHRHSWGTFRSNGYTLVGQVFIPENARGTVFALHGYMDHTGILRHLIGHCLSHGYAVASYDLPGHGLSSGSYASIPSFSDYARVFSDFVNLMESQLPAPYHLVSHSTAGAISLEYLRGQGTNPFARVILVAPLIRHAHWYPVKFFFRLGQIMQFTSVARRYPADSGDKDFLTFRKKDPLSFKRVPAQWVAALYHWEKRLRQADLQCCPNLVIQGACDSILDETYNIRFLQEKCPGIRVRWIERGMHYLLNESPAIRQEVLDAVTEAMSAINPYDKPG